MATLHSPSRSPSPSPSRSRSPFLRLQGILEVGGSAEDKSKKKWKKRLICVRQMKESGQGVLEVYASTKVRPQFQVPSGVILLTPGLQVYLPSESHYPNVFVAEGPDTIIFLAATSQEERASWMNAIQGLETFKEGKLKPDAEWFTVKGVDSEHMRLIGCPNGDCILAIDREEIQLANLRSKKFIVRWPLHCLRRYVCEMDEFKIFTGRRAPRGEGEYTFRSANAGQIYSTLERFIELKAQELQQQQQVSKSDSLENRPPAPLPTPAVSCLPPQAGEEHQDSSVKYHEITSDLVPNRVCTSNGGSEGYSRTHHDLGPQFNQADEGGAVAMGDGLYNTLQHMDKDKSKTWRTATIDSKASYEMAKHTAPKTGPDPIYNVAYPTTSDPKDIPKPNTSQAQASQLSPDSHSATNPAYQSLGEVVDEPKPQPQLPAANGPKEYKSSLLEKSGGDSKVQRSYSMVKKDRLRVPDNDQVHRPSYLVKDESDLEDEIGSPPSVPPRREYSRSECAELELDTSSSPSVPGTRFYTKSECDELALSSSPPELPPRSYTNASSLSEV